MDQYNKINSLLISNINKQNKYLFFDIFNRNNELVLICPIYEQIEINYDKIIAYNNGIELCYKNIIKCNDIYEQIVVIIFENFTYDPILNIKITYEDLEQTYQLSNINVTKNTYFLTHTTLFKDDYYLINIFYDYYINNGVDYFYLYYNGKLTNKIKDKVKDKNIILIEWNYSYYNNTETYNHHAQMGQIQHALYKYNKPFSKYTIYADLDEYLFINGKTLITYIKNNIYNFYRFINLWCSTLNNDIPKEFPINNKIKVDKNYIPVRSKCIYENDKFYMINIHFPRYDLSKFTYNIINTDIGRMYHFSNWTQRDRQLEEFDIVDL